MKSSNLFLFISSALSLLTTLAILYFWLPDSFIQQVHIKLFPLYIALPLWSFGFLFYSVLYLRPPKEIVLLFSIFPLVIWIILTRIDNYFIEKYGITIDQLTKSIFHNPITKFILATFLAVSSVLIASNSCLNLKRYFRNENLIFAARSHGRVELPATPLAFLLNLVWLIIAVSLGMLCYQYVS